MKRIVMLLMAALWILNMQVKSQISIVRKDHYNVDNNTNVTTYDISSEPVIVINHEMIKRFNNVNTGGEYLTWRDLILGYDIESLRDLYYAYINCDLEKESLHEIKLALEEKRLNYDRIETGNTQEYFAEDENKKASGSSNMIVQKAE